MAFKLTVAEQKRFDLLVAKFNTEAGDVAFALDSFNEAVAEARLLVATPLERLNEAREEIRAFIEDIVSEKEGEYDDKSDNWRDGERGDATRTWIDRIDEIKAAFEDDIEIEFPDDLEFDADNLDVKEHLDEGLPSEPEY